VGIDEIIIRPTGRDPELQSCFVWKSHAPKLVKLPIAVQKSNAVSVELGCRIIGQTQGIPACFRASTAHKQCLVRQVDDHWTRLQTASKQRVIHTAVVRTSTPVCNVATTALLALAIPTVALGQEAAETSVGQIAEIIVTAEKQAQSANTVGMPIIAATGEVLQERGITSVADLTRLVAGLTIQQSSFNSTSFTLRGVGFFNSDLATPPAVTVYVDETPLPFPAMTKLAAFDLTRVEVLEGPQGTLFGQNATGGAVNYIAAKPTEAFAAGVDATYGRLNRLQVGGFVSGPINDQLGVRIAVQGERGDPWQESITRPGDELGKIRELQGRATLEWHPDAQFVSRLTFTSTYDGSDSLAAQFIAPTVTFPALAVPGLLTFPVVNQPRAADWSPLRPDTNQPFPYASDTTLYQLSWRNDYRLRDDVTLTSLTSYAHFLMAYGQDPSGTPYYIDDVIDSDGRAFAFFQELRVAGRQGKVNWLLGANYAHEDVKDEPLEFFSDVDLSHLFQGVDPQAYGDESLFPAHMRANTDAVFGRIEYNATEQIMIEGGVRYNADRRTFDNCSIAVTDHFASFWNLFRGGAQPPTQVGDCYVLDPANGLQPVDDVHNTLNQDSVSWRTGLNWTARPGLLLYANVSKGYKAGAVPVLAASTVDQFKPVPQESLLAYEAGFKAGLLDHRVQFNASAFYYDYKDKQLRGAELDPTFGPLEALVSIPKSHVEGVETQIIARPTERLTLDTSATYLDTKIDQFTGFNALAHFGDQAGTPFPFSPRWQSITNIDYAFPLSPGMKGFVGGSLIYNSQTYSGVGALYLMRIDSFTLLDLRAGAEFGNGRYRVWAWGKNVTNEYYWSNVFANGNAIARFVGQPATYGVSLSGRF
jgi:iron complex outermembrane receptor protein